MCSSVEMAISGCIDDRQGTWVVCMVCDLKKIKFYMRPIIISKRTHLAWNPGEHSDVGRIAELLRNWSTGKQIIIKDHSKKTHLSIMQ